jgi:polyisoprenoid-binding protein YceI
MRNWTATAGRYAARLSLFPPLSARSILIVLVSFLLLSPVTRGQESVVNLNPAQTTIEFSLDATLHTVHGTFKLKNGQIHFDSATGKASGQIVVDATTGDSGNQSRDKKMHREILESQKYPEIVFVPTEVRGTLNPQGESQVVMAGVIRLHGQDHEMEMTVAVSPSERGRIRASTRFAIPYIRWGLKNPSTMFLHVSDEVKISIVTSAQFSTGEASR